MLSIHFFLNWFLKNILSLFYLLLFKSVFYKKKLNTLIFYSWDSGILPPDTRWSRSPGQNVWGDATRKPVRTWREAILITLVTGGGRQLQKLRVSAVTIASRVITPVNTAIDGDLLLLRTAALCHCNLADFQYSLLLDGFNISGYNIDRQASVFSEGRL